ncbi:HdeD family acid-resistance protein [Sinanaerobacter chloroacetimidivorans]|jgi:uncharacterized membrane protein HdeD (DUF308 family)|uniref:DUF308 domain-containing protein n=1 Tax=Sinanaerobacter chloroacetimidivorans TaxID=2818044 RepID=A0A8J7W0Z0_9FIRM|nr:DUF308 domain-containing protein [Sinanaerobacter chloroacetimidivorans]MBR0598799.1 DUF308 domain-containing protein [Sinanaerobacter chloroacetimidivorans]
MRLLKIIAGAILILTGVFCFANQGATFLTIAFILGCAMLISGISGILAYLFIRKNRELSNMVFTEGVMTFLLGSLVLSNQLITEAVVPVFFGLWAIFSGVLRISEAFGLHNKRKRAWQWTLGLGAISILAGIYAFLNSVIASLSVILIIGFIFIIQGANVLIAGIHLPANKKSK